MSEHHARVMGVPRDTAVGHRPRHRCVSPVRSASSQQRGAGMGDEVLGVGGYFGAADRAATMYLQGALLLGVYDWLSNRHSPS